MLTTFRAFGPADQPSDPNLPFMFRHFDQIFVAVGLLQAVVGAFLLSGGLLIRSRKPSGPRLVVAALSLVLFYIVAFTITFVPAAGFKGFPGPFAVMFFVFAILNGAVWAFALWFPLRLLVVPNPSLQRTRLRSPLNSISLGGTMFPCPGVVIASPSSSASHPQRPGARNALALQSWLELKA
jgi:hypothetical protein